MVNMQEHRQIEEHEPLINIDAVVLGRNVARLRKEAKLTKHKFALMVNVGRPFLNRIENGTADPRLSIIRRLAEALAVSPQDLLRDPHAPQSGQPPKSSGHARLL